MTSVTGEESRYHTSWRSSPRENSSNSVVCLPDDYGECDASLQNYRTDVGAKPSLPLHQNLVSDDNASKMLQQCLRKFGPSSGERLVVSETGMCSFLTAGGHKFELCIRTAGLKKTVSMSVVIHKVKQHEGTHGSTSDSNRGRRTTGSSRGSYSLMTKMMKYNTIYNRQSSTRASNADGGYIGSFDGTFIFFKNVDISALSSEGQLESVLEGFMLKAVELSMEFGKTTVDDLEARKKHLKRRHGVRYASRRSYP